MDSFTTFTEALISYLFHALHKSFIAEVHLKRYIINWKVAY